MQAHNLPLGKLTKNFATELAKRIGILLDIDCVGDGVQISRSFLRFRVSLDITKPLSLGYYMEREGLETLFLTFKYERLGNFCYACGRLGHGDENCIYPKDQELAKHVGLKLKANTVKRLSPCPNTMPTSSSFVAPNQESYQ